MTGATGKVGQTFIRRALAAAPGGDVVIRALCHQRTLPAAANLEVVRGSISDRAVAAEAMADVTHSVLTVLRLATRGRAPNGAAQLFCRNLPA